jgi:hypothetical protein
VIWRHKLLQLLNKIRSNSLTQKKCKKITHWFTKCTLCWENTVSADTDNQNNHLRWRTSKQLTRETARWIASMTFYIWSGKFENSQRCVV